MYVTKSGDTWDGIAKTIYDDEMRADVLMAANREYNDVYQFDSGVQLVTPEVTVKTEVENLPPWKK
jgi:nucleoid-associated protein YgaU